MSAARLPASSLLGVLASALVCLSCPATAQPTGPTSKKTELGLPEITHAVDAGNLTIYWLLCLQEEFSDLLESVEAAVAAGTCKITERADGAQVARLDIHNQGQKPIYLQAGATLRGGKQDRTLASDVVIPPLTRLSVPTYCIERSRWRGGSAFGTPEQLAFIAPSRGLKVYAQYPMNHQQHSVWQEVDVLKRAAVKAGVLSGSTSSSLNEELGKIVASKPFRHYVDVLKGIEPPADAVGMAVVINGRVANIDLYGQRKLFRQQWVKLRNSAAFEALLQKPKPAAVAKAEKADTANKVHDSKPVENTEVMNTIRGALAWRRSRPEPHQTRKTGPVEQRVIGKRDGERVMFDYAWSGRCLHVQIVFPEKRGG